MTPTRFEDLPLRQRKHAQTKLALLDATFAALEERTLDEVPVKQLAREVGVSEATFFNYFPSKDSVLVYYVQLWSIEMGWHAARWAKERGGLGAIEEVFVRTARELVRRPQPMAEVIAWQAGTTEPPRFHDIGLAERLLRFPDLDGIEQVAAQGLDELLPPLIRQAVRLGELPRRVDQGSVLVSLASLFFGIPIVLRRTDPRTIEDTYLTQLHILWSGLGARPTKEKS